MGRASPVVEGLTRDERDRLADALGAVSRALRVLLEGLSEEASRATGLARVLEIDRVTAHRAMALARRGGREAGDLVSAPGTAALRSVGEALRRHGASATRVTSLERAVDGLDRCLREMGGSKSAVERRLALTLADGGEDPVEAERAQRRLRESLNAAAAGLLGVGVRFRADVSIFRLNREDETMLDYAHARALVGHHGRPGGKPTGVHFVSKPTEGMERGERYRALGGRLEDGVVLEQFSSSPVPLVASRGSGARMRYVVEAREGEEVDVVVAHGCERAARHPAHDPKDRTLEVGGLVREPTGVLVLDAFVERRALATARPTARSFVWSPALEHSLEDHWLDELGTTPELRVLGAREADWGCAGWDRLGEMESALFARAGWDPSSFVGYRLLVERPMWGGAYFISLDYEDRAG